MLTIWDWEDEQMGLHSKAFGQDVYNVRFSDDDPGRLTTSGTAHIKFWKIANTFTGLKLQGAIGKFGKIKLSDVDTFTELPDGKVVSSTETGSLLLWEANFIKCRLTRTGGQLCHNGAITYVSIDHKEQCIISAGIDGYIRWWDLTVIDNAEVDADHSMDFELDPRAEFYLGDGIGVKSMVDSSIDSAKKRLLVILDTIGRVASYSFVVHDSNTTDTSMQLCQSVLALKDYQLEKLRDVNENTEFIVDEDENFYIDKRVFESFHAAPITGMDTCHADHLVGTCSLDGTVRCIDYINRTLIAMRSFDSPATCLKWLPSVADPTGRCLVVGFADGIIRVLVISALLSGDDDYDDTVDDASRAVEDDSQEHRTRKRNKMALQLKMVFKPHNAAVTDISFNMTGTILATSGNDGIIFFFRCVPVNMAAAPKTAAQNTDGSTTAAASAPVFWTPIRFVTVVSTDKSAVASSNLSNSSSSTNIGDNSSGSNSGLVSCKSLSWSSNGIYLLASCSDGVMRELDLRPLRSIVAQFGVVEKEIVTYEAKFVTREIITRVPIVTTVTPTAATTTSTSSTVNSSSNTNNAATTPVATAQSKIAFAAGSNSSTTNGDKLSSDAGSDTPLAPTSVITASVIPARISLAVYTVHRNTPGILTAATLSQKSYMFEVDGQEELPLRELQNGVYTSDGKDQMKNAVPTSMRYSWTKNFLIVGTADGSVAMRPSKHIETFARAPGHSTGANNSSNTGYIGVTCATCSYDDRYLLSVGADGVLIVRRVRLDLFSSRAVELFKDIEAGVFGTSIVKPMSMQKEPNYLTFVSSLSDSPEDDLFPLSKTHEPRQISLVDSLRTVVDPMDDNATKDEEEQADLAPGAYSIQDNRLKLEENAKECSAEELKGRVRAAIVALRRDYLNIIRENDTIPDVARLSADEMLVDKEFFAILAAQGVSMVEEVHKECAYEAEKAEARLRKISHRLMDGLLMEEITLAALDRGNHVNSSNIDSTKQQRKRQSSSVVMSLRSRSLDPYVEQILKEVHNMVRAAELREAQIRTNETAQRKATEAIDELKHRLQRKEEGGGNDDPANGGVATGGSALPSHVQLEKGPSMSGEVASIDQIAAESSVSARRERRKERKEGLKKHLLEKPNEDEDDIRDLNAIKLAEKTVGDYKLKCADDYEVPEEQRINALRKIRQMAMLEESMLSMRLQFNERFLALRTLKRQMIYAIRRDNQRIREIDAELDQPDQSIDLWEPQFNPDEFPDDADEVTASELNEYEAARRNTEWDKLLPPKHNVITGTKTEVFKNARTGAYDAILQTLIAKENAVSNASRVHNNNNNTANNNNARAAKLHNILSDENLINFTPPRTEPPRYYEMSSSLLKTFVREPLSKETKRMNDLEKKVPSLTRIKTAMHARMHTQSRSSAQEEELALARQKLVFERQMILQKMDENLSSFREAVDDLRTDRHSITADLKLAELKLLVLFQEYQLLQTFESRDAALQQKQLRCKGEESEIIALANENKAKLESKEDEILHWTDKLAQISQEFKSMLPEVHPYYDTLTRIFRKKVKRTKGHDDADEDDDYEDDDVSNIYMICVCFI